MLSSLSSIAVVLWFAGIVSQLALAFLLVLRRAYKPFPFFTLYVIQANVVVFALVGLAAFGNEWWYGAGFYASSIVDSLLALLVISEFLVTTFGPQAARPRILTIYLASAMAGAYLITGSIGAIFLAANPWRRGEQLFLALATATLWVFFLGRDALKLAWGKRTAAIGRGMLVYLTAALFTAFANGRVPKQMMVHVAELSQLSYLIAIIFWCRAFWPTQAAPAPPDPQELKSLRSMLEEDHNELNIMRQKRS